MPSASGPGLYKGLEDKETVFFVEMGKRSGGLDIKVEGEKKKERERELYCAKEGENCLKIERENDKRKIILNCKREKKRETL